MFRVVATDAHKKAYVASLIKLVRAVFPGNYSFHRTKTDVPFFLSIFVEQTMNALEKAGNRKRVKSLESFHFHDILYRYLKLTCLIRISLNIPVVNN